MTNTQSHAQREMDILKRVMPDALVIEFEPEILALCEKFGQSGQSGGSAPYTAGALSSAIKKLCLQETISPITGEESEWNFDHIDDEMYQNNREGAIFKNGKDGRAYYLDAIIWAGDTVGESGNKWDTFTGSVDGIYSRQYVKSFPFTPKRFYIDVSRVLYDPAKHKESDAVSCGDGDYVYFIKDKSQLDEVFKYYDRYDYVKKERPKTEIVEDPTPQSNGTQN